MAIRPDDGKTSNGDELRVRAGAGSSEGRALVGAEFEGRLLVAQRNKALSLGAGPAYLHWLGPAALTFSVAPALGLEQFDDTLAATDHRAGQARPRAD